MREWITARWAKESSTNEAISNLDPEVPIGVGWMKWKEEHFRRCMDRSMVGEDKK